MGRQGHIGGHVGIRGRGFVGPPAFRHRAFTDRRGFAAPIFRRRFDHFDSFAFPGNGFFFGFPHDRLDLFGIPGPGLHFGFPRQRFFFGFPFFGFPFFGFPHHHRFDFFGRFGFFGPGWFPVGIVLGGPYLGAPVTGRAADTLPATGIQVASPRVAVTGAGGAGDSLVVERVTVVDRITRTGLRLTWQGAGQPAQEVTLFLADAARNMLAMQTGRAPPYRALFEPPPGTAFAGVTVVWADGSASTRVVAYRPLGR